MLVLTRRVEAGNGSVICIGNDVEVTLVAVRGEQVRLGVSAPREVPVHRSEVYDEIALETGAMMATARLLGELDAPGSSLDRDEWMGPFPEE